MPLLRVFWRICGFRPTAAPLHHRLPSIQSSDEHLGGQPDIAMMGRCRSLVLRLRRPFTPLLMHGTYTHRITCNLYPDQYFKISHAASQFQSRVAPFLRDVALAYLDQKSLLPASLKANLRGMIVEIGRVSTGLHQITERATTYQRLTHDDLRKSAELVVMLERQVTMLRAVLESLPLPSAPADDHQVDAA